MKECTYGSAFLFHIISSETINTCLAAAPIPLARVSGLLPAGETSARELSQLGFLCLACDYEIRIPMRKALSLF